jgi:hypothetical protein
VKIRYYPDADALSVDLRDNISVGARVEDLTNDGQVRARYAADGEPVSAEVRARVSTLCDLAAVAVAIMGDEGPRCDPSPRCSDHLTFHDEPFTMNTP